jgi:hypothetical protein
MNKKKDKDKLSHAQFQILCKQDTATNKTNKWIKDCGLNVSTFTQTHPKLLVAQKMAYELLQHHAADLTSEQLQALRTFKLKMSSRNQREKLKPQASFQIFNIGTKLKRKLHQQQHPI